MMSKHENDDQAESQVQNQEQDQAKLEAPTAIKEPEQKPASVPSPKAPKTKAEKSGNGVAWFAVLLSLTSLGLLGAGGYYGYQLHTQLQADKQQLQLAQAEQMQQLQTELNNQVNQATAKINQAQQQKVNDINKQLADNISTVNSKVAEISGRQPSDWAIAEANYLVRMAGRKLWLENDIETAQHLLATADMRISELSNPTLMPIRKAIVNDIATVRALPQPRVTDIHLALSGLISQLDDLPLNYVQENHQPKKIQQAPTVSSDINDWQDNLTTSLSGVFSKLFYINTGVQEGASEPYKMPRQQWFLRANVRLAWLQAQNALLSHNQEVYQDSLNRSIEWLGHFKQTDSRVKAAMTTLQALIADPITATYPEKLQSQLLLESTLRERLSTVPLVGENVEEVKPAESQAQEQQNEQGQAL